MSGQITNFTHQAAVRRRWAQKKRRNGLCSQCNHPAIPGKSRCSSCRELLGWNNRKRRSGITKTEFEHLWEIQGGLCALCREPVGHNAHADHDHKTKRIRGLLCSGCNLGLGHFRDNPFVLRLAATYIERYREDQRCDSI